MNEQPLSYIADVIQAAYGGDPDLVRRERVVDHYADGELIDQEFEVLVFRLELDGPLCRWCYAWEIGGEVTATLHTRVTRCAWDAVMRRHRSTDSPLPG